MDQDRRAKASWATDRRANATMATGQEDARTEGRSDSRALVRYGDRRVGRMSEYFCAIGDRCVVFHLLMDILHEYLSESCTSIWWSRKMNSVITLLLVSVICQVLSFLV